MMALHTLPLWLKVGLVIVWLGLVGAIAAGVERSGLGDPERVRKVVHIGAGNVILLAWWLDIPGWLGIAASVLFSGITLLSYYLPLLPSINSVGRQSLGTFFYAVSIGVLIALFWETTPQFAALGILVMTWGDGLAALVGQTWGRHPYTAWGVKKSWEGSLTMTVVSFGVSSAILIPVQGAEWPTWVVAGAIALAATLTEAFSRWGIDNLTVPLLCAGGGLWLNTLLTAPPL